MPERVIAVFPHPDDETFGNGGMLALHAKRGDQVTVVCGTLGQMGRNMGKPFFANRETLPELRKEELRDACDALGVQDLRLLGLRDKTVEFEDPEYLAGMLVELMNEIKPTRVYTYYPKHGVHPDHDALSAATVLAVAKLAEDRRPAVYARAITKNCSEVLGAPDVTVDVSEVFEEKLNAIRAHRSQSEANMKRMNAEIAEHPERKTELEARFKTETYWIYAV